VNLPFNFFDLLLLFVLVAGLVRGRKQGFSLELLSLLKWLTLLLVCAVVYGPAGVLMAESGNIDLLSGYLVAYLGTALAVLILFLMIQKRVGTKLIGSDVFGRGEYYLGMGSGMVRFACMLLAALALLNARAFSPAEIAAMDKFQQDNYGSHVFPGLHSLQVAVFDDSLVGSFIKQDLGFLLIAPTEPNQKEPSQHDTRPAPAAVTASARR
jgi:uncharacterized membrane protein required for colicin V production